MKASLIAVAFAGLAAAIPTGWEDADSSVPSVPVDGGHSTPTPSLPVSGGEGDQPVPSKPVDGGEDEKPVEGDEGEKPVDGGEDGDDSDWADCGPTKECFLTDEMAEEIITVYETLISRSVTGAEFNATADSILAPEFFTMSNSINAETGRPLETLSIPNATTFKRIFSAQPPSPGTETLDMFHSCSKIAWRWLGTSPEGLPVRGLTMMEITEEGKIADTFVEYFRPALANCTV